jgi:hypothetical protein
LCQAGVFARLDQELEKGLVFAAESRSGHRQSLLS